VPTYSVSGTVTSENVCLSDVTVTLIGIGSVNTATDANGNYSFSGAANGNYTIKPSKTGYIFTPAYRNITVNDVNLTGQNFTVASFPHGSLDASFGTCGIVTTPVGSSYALGIQSDNKIVVAGSSYNGNNSDFSLVRYNANGSLDTSFGTGGKVTTDVGSNHDFANALGIQPDDKIVVAGSTYNGSNRDFALVRYNSDGSLDTTFGTNGKVITDFGIGDDSANALSIQSDGKIVVAGYSYYQLEYDNISLFALVRYNSDGSLDATFGGDGKVTAAVGNSSNSAKAIGIQSDGKIVAAGSSYNHGGNSNFAIMRYNVDGSYDATFGTFGKVTTSVVSGDDSANALGIQSDGKIVVAGDVCTNSSYDSCISDFAIVRYNTNGSLDTTFGTGGKVTTALGSSDDRATALGIQSDGKIVVAGSSSNGNNYDFALLRYNLDGSLDTTFGTNGKVTTALGSNDDHATALGIQSDGKIMVTGYSYNGSDNDFALARYWP
jgi:uncharacterized delta-60 repeat protein